MATKKTAAKTAAAKEPEPKEPAKETTEPTQPAEEPDTTAEPSEGDTEEPTGEVKLSEALRGPSTTDLNPAYK